jgi:hypothetical protein
VRSDHREELRPQKISVFLSKIQEKIEKAKQEFRHYKAKPPSLSKRMSVHSERK